MPSPGLYTDIREAAEAPAILCRADEATSLAPKAAGTRADFRQRGRASGCDWRILHPYNFRVSLPSVGSEATLLDRCGPTAAANRDTASFQRDLWLQAARPRAAPPSLSLRAVKC